MLELNPAARVANEEKHQAYLKRRDELYKKQMAIPEKMKYYMKTYVTTTGTTTYDEPVWFTTTSV